MSKVEAVEREVQSLSASELAAFRQWFLEFDAAAWDQQRKAGEPTVRQRAAAANIPYSDMPAAVGATAADPVSAAR